MHFTDCMDLGTGDVISLIGMGGKTTTMYRLVGENRTGRVLMSTTTHIRMPPEAMMDRVLGKGEKPGGGVNLVYDRIENGKLAGLPPDKLRGYIPADGIAVLECDGSRGLPLKGWAEHEPVIPEETTVTLGICVVWPIGHVLTEDIVHRPTLFHHITETEPGDICAAEHIARMIAHPEGMFAKARGRRLLLINQVEHAVDWARASSLVALLHGIKIFAGSAQTGNISRWEDGRWTSR